MSTETVDPGLETMWEPWCADDVFTAYETWRQDRGPVAFDAGTQTWFVVGYAAAREVLTGDGWSSDPLSSDVVRDGLALQGIDDLPFGGGMLTADPPAHGRMRDAVRDVFTPNYIDQLAPGIDAIAAGAVDAIPRGEQVEFMTTIARPFPVAVIAEWLALDPVTTAILWDRADDLVRLLDGVIGVEPSTGTISAMSGLVAEFLPIAASRRIHPGDDLLSLLAGDKDLALDEVVANAILLAVAGHETTAGLLGNALVRLLSGAEGERLADRIGLVGPTGVDEFIRLDGPPQAVGRTSLREQCLEGLRLLAGQRVIVVVAAANRDPGVFERPSSFDPERRSLPHLGLGFGRHRCLGGALAKLEARIALNRILARDPVLVPGSVQLRRTSLLRAPESVRIEFRR
ncbi:cytochrome P450 [Gordonia sp. (in: high G+C Gram-positive bacteria)]|uniref:cytochrome P450 n=1 Tax=Gordonia sp. (in: high G+C Gram-positive bacteria) TaxID=84139 RepID=UPI0039E67DCA